MAINAVGLNYMLDQLRTAGKVAYMALFTDDAATVEVSGGSPAYARKAVTWDAAGTGGAGRIQLNSTLPNFDVPACTVKAVGFYDTLTGGTQYSMYNVSPDEVFASQGIYSITAGSTSIT
jgi:hypothetical protein